MAGEKTRGEKMRDEILAEFLEWLVDPVHKRIIEAYVGDEPVVSMEQELSKLLEAVAKHED